MKVIILNRVCDPYEPPAVDAICTSLEKLLALFPKRAIYDIESTVVYQPGHEKEGYIDYDKSHHTWTNLRTGVKTRKLYTDFGPDYYIEWVELDTKLVEK